MTEREALRHFLEWGPNTPAHRLKTLLRKKNPEIQVTAPASERGQPPMQRSIIPYNGGNGVVLKIKKHLRSHPHPALSAALVHGSTATNEEKAYSDFDGILIVDRDRLKTRRDRNTLRQIIRDTRRLMYEQDALQHHGWQVAFTDEFHQQQTSGIVPGVWRTCRSIYPEGPLSLCTAGTAPSDLRKNFAQLTRSIEKKINRRDRYRDRYFFKNLMSEILLLPAVFLQMSGHPEVTKKESFSLIREYFKEDELMPLSRVSAWRERWIQPRMNGTLRLFHMLRQSGLYIPFLSSKTQPDVYGEADEKWAAALMKLIALMKRRSA